MIIYCRSELARDWIPFFNTHNSMLRSHCIQFWYHYVCNQQIASFTRSVLNDNTVGFPDERQVFQGIFILFFAVAIIVEGNLGYIQLDQTP